MSVAVFSVNEVKDEHTGNQKEKSTLQKMDDKRVSRLGTGVNTGALSLIWVEREKEEKKQTLLMMTNFTADFSLETNTKTKTVAVTVERQCVCIWTVLKCLCEPTNWNH